MLCLVWQILQYHNRLHCTLIGQLILPRRTTSYTLWTRQRPKRPEFCGVSRKTSCLIVGCTRKKARRILHLTRAPTPAFFNRTTISPLGVCPSLPFRNNVSWVSCRHLLLTMVVPRIFLPVMDAFSPHNGRKVTQYIPSWPPDRPLASQSQHRFHKKFDYLGYVKPAHLGKNSGWSHDPYALHSIFSPSPVTLLERVDLPQSWFPGTAHFFHQISQPFLSSAPTTVTFLRYQWLILPATYRRFPAPWPDCLGTVLIVPVVRSLP
jgi:hypothetical protein